MRRERNSRVRKARLAAVGYGTFGSRAANGFNFSVLLFERGRHLGANGARMYEIGVWEVCRVLSGKDAIFCVRVSHYHLGMPARP